MRARAMVLVVGLLTVLFATACGEPPRRLVIEDGDPELVDNVLTGLSELEQRADCRFFKSLDVGGKSKDWKGEFPPRGTVTVQVNPDKVRPGKAGWTTFPKHRRVKARVFLVSNHEHSGVPAHELLHALGMDHTTDEPGKLMSGGSRIGWEFDPEMMDEIKSLCLPE